MSPGCLARELDNARGQEGREHLERGWEWGSPKQRLCRGSPGSRSDSATDWSRETFCNLPPSSLRVKWGQCLLGSGAARIRDTLCTLPGTWQVFAVMWWLRPVLWTRGPGCGSPFSATWAQGVGWPVYTASLSVEWMARAWCSVAVLLRRRWLKGALPNATCLVSTGKPLVIAKKWQWLVLFSCFQYCFGPFLGLKDAFNK